MGGVDTSSNKEVDRRRDMHRKSCSYMGMNCVKYLCEGRSGCCSVRKVNFVINVQIIVMGG